MGRPENTISASGPVADFAQQLRLLRQHAALTLRQLAARTELSTATLSVAASGRKLPTWEVARAYVQACGGGTDDSPGGCAGNMPPAFPGSRWRCAFPGRCHPRLAGNTARTASVFPGARRRCP